MQKTVVQQAKKEALPHQDHRRGIPPYISQGEPALLPSITHTAEELSQHPEKPKRTNFTQLPNCVIDSDLPETTLMGFIRFMRHCGRNGVFTGSLRKLCKLLRMARMTVARMITSWAEAGWIIKTTRPKADEEGESMCLILLEERLWEQNSARYGKTSDAEKTVPNLDQTVPNLDQTVPNLDQTVPNLDQTVPPPSTKQRGNIEGNMDSNTSLNTKKEYGRNTDALPALLPSSVFSFEELTNDSPHHWEALHVIATHYLGASKVTQSDAEVLVKKTQSVANLASPHEIRRQLVRNITFMLYSDHKLNWFKDKRGQVTLHNIATYWDDYTAKAQKAEWSPPEDKLPTWWNDAAPPEEASGAALIGMSRQEADTLAALIQAQYPGMKLCYGHLPGDLWTVALSLGDDEWLDLFAPEEWHNREQLMPDHWAWVLQAYQQSRSERQEVA